MRYLLILLLTGCSSTGIRVANDYPWHSIPTSEQMCLQVDPTIARERVSQCQAELTEYASQYGIAVEYTVVPHERAATTIFGLTKDLKGRYIPKQCDRIMSWVGARWHDRLWDTASLVYPLPSVYGWVSDSTTKGYAFAERKGPTYTLVGSIANGSTSACSGIIHEWDHMHGCGHGFTKAKCYQRIWYTKVNSVGGDFVAGWTVAGAPCLTREACDTHDEMLYGVKYEN